MFGARFLTGESPFWANPSGIFPNSLMDMPTTLSGYAFFQRGSWQWPLFHVDKLGAPEGINILFTDSIPWVALAGRLVFRATGIPVNLYGLWTGLCFIAGGMSMTGLVAALGQRSIAAAVMATLTGVGMPALLARWGHLSLMGQFEIPLALMFYVRNRNETRPWPLFAKAALLLLLALWTHTYLFAMVGAIVLATILQASFGGALRERHRSGVLAGLAVVLGAVILASGYGQSRGAPFSAGFGRYSTNLLSPLLSAGSALVPAIPHLTPDEADGQYEGASYLGAGILLLLLATLPFQLRMLRGVLRRHRCLLVILLGCTLFAVSNKVMLGDLRLLDIPLPRPVLQVVSVFRAGGRFVWPVMYAVAALAIAAVIPLYGRRGVLLLCAAAVLQWVDVAPLRGAVAASVRATTPLLVDRDAWRTALSRQRAIRVLPTFDCLAIPREWSSLASVQFQLLAADAGIPINTVYAARIDSDCPRERPVEALIRPGIGELTVLLEDHPDFATLRARAAGNPLCAAGTRLIVCTDIDANRDLLPALARGRDP